MAPDREAGNETVPTLGSSATTFVISRTFDAPRALMWEVWTKPDHLKQWFSPRGITTFSSTNDLRPGGVMHYGMRGPDGSVIWGKWVYREIVPPERLVFVVSFSDEAGGYSRHPGAPEWPMEILSVVTFAGEGTKTTVTVEWTAINATELERTTFDTGKDSMTQGWTGTLDQLAEYLEKV